MASAKPKGGDIDNYGHGPKLKPREIPEIKSRDVLPSVTITHVESPSLFFVYLNDKGYNLDKELNIFMPQYKSMFEYGKDPPIPYTRCVCSFSADGLWYRAIVVDSYVADDDAFIVRVYFCDYGNTEDIDWSENRIYRMPNYFATKFPMQAIPCAQYGIQPNDEDGWTEKEIEDFSDQLNKISDDLSSTLKCRFYLSPRIERILTFVNLYPSEMKEGTSLRDLTAAVGRRWSISNNRCNMEIIQSLLPEFLFDIQPIRLPNVSTASNACLSPSQVNKEANSNQRRESIENSSIDSNSRGPRIDRKEANDAILRHLGILPTSQKSSVETLPEQDSEEDKSGACSPITTVICRPPTLPSEFPHGSVCIQSHFKNIPDLKLRAGGDKVFKVILSAVDNPNRFFVNICDNDTSEVMSWLEEAMYEHYSIYYRSIMKKFFDESTPPSEGDIVCAESESNFCGRAVIEELLKKKKNADACARVFFIDYGFRETVLLSKIHLLSPDYLFQMPAQALECSLVGVSPKGDNWTNDDKEAFMNACGVADSYGAISGLMMNIAGSEETKHFSTSQPLKVYLSKEDDDELINTVRFPTGKCELDKDLIEVESDVITADLVSSPGEQSYNAVSDDSSGIDEDWNVTSAVYQQSVNKFADRKRLGTSVKVCEFFKVRGKCLWGDKCSMYHTREDYEGNRVNLEFKKNVKEKELVAFLNTGIHMSYPQKGAWVGIIVTTMYQPNRFYASLIHGPTDYMSDDEASSTSSLSTLSQLILSMNRFYNDVTPLDMSNKLFAPGELLAVRCRDGNWHRAQVLDHDSDSVYVIVKLLDTGDVEPVHQSSAHPLEPHFLNSLPVQAFECFLTGVVRPLMGWTKQAWRAVVEHVDGCPLHARVDEVSPIGALTLTVWSNFNKSTKDYVCINDLLIHEELAAPPTNSKYHHGLSGPWTCVDDPSFVVYPG